MQHSHTQRVITTHSARLGVTAALVQNIMALYKVHPFALNKKQIFIGTVKESEPVFVFVPVPVKMGYANLKWK